MRIFTLFATFLFAFGAFSAISIRGGGDDVPMEFWSSFHQAFSEIRDHQPDIYAQISAVDWEEYIKTLPVYSTQEPIKVKAGEGMQDSVADNGDGNIRVNSFRWERVSHDCIRQAIALHEVFSTKQLEGTGLYPISAAYLAKCHIQNDPQIIISGEDPITKSKLLSRKTTCSKNVVLRDLKTNIMTHENRFEVSSGADWKVLDRDYYLQYTFGVESKDKNLIPVVTQGMSSQIWNPEFGIVYHAKGRLLGWTPLQVNGLVDVSPPASDRFYEKTNDGRYAEWNLVNGKRGEQTSFLTKTPMSNGAVRDYQEMVISSQHDPNWTATVSTSDCVEESVDKDTWIKQSGDPNIAFELDKISARVILVNEADRAYKACLPETCANLKQQVHDRLKEFEEAWDQLYANRRRQIAADHNKPFTMPTPSIKNVMPIIKPKLETRSQRGVTRMPGQSQYLSRGESGALKALQDFQKSH